MKFFLDTPKLKGENPPANLIRAACGEVMCKPEFEELCRDAELIPPCPFGVQSAVKDVTAVGDQWVRIK